MKRLITILLNMLLILACILVGGAMALTCWLAPLPPGEANLQPVQIMMEDTWITNPLA